MFIHFDTKNIHVQVICGTLEEYTPTDKIREIQDKTSKLRAAMEKFMLEIVEPGIKEIQEMVTQQNDQTTKAFKTEEA